MEVRGSTVPLAASQPLSGGVPHTPSPQPRWQHSPWDVMSPPPPAVGAPPQGRAPGSERDQLLLVPHGSIICSWDAKCQILPAQTAPA